MLHSFALVAILAVSSMALDVRAAPRTIDMTPDDYAAIVQIYSTYVNLLDNEDVNGIAKLFVPDATYSSELTHHSAVPAQKIIARIVRNSRGKNHPRHLISNVLIKTSPQGIIGTCFLVVLDMPPRSGNLLNGATGYYDDVLIKTNRGWRFKARTLWMDGEKGSPHNGLTE